MPAGGEDTAAGGRDPHAVQSPRSSTSISPETVSQAGAGALLLAVAVVELWLAFWAAGWSQRCGASLVAVVGAALLVRAVAAIVLPLRADLARPVRRLEPHPAPAPAARAVLAE